jgi:hypothetical protein
MSRAVNVGCFNEHKQNRVLWDGATTYKHKRLTLDVEMNNSQLSELTTHNFNDYNSQLTHNKQNRRWRFCKKLPQGTPCITCDVTHSKRARKAVTLA